MGFVTLAITTSAQATTLNLQDVPLYLTSHVDPNVLLNMSVETPMGGGAYTDNVGIPAACGGRINFGGNSDIGSCYLPAIEYLGYFDPKKCYIYSGLEFDPAGSTAADHSCSSKWSGNFLNWASMTAIDMFVWTMTGGNRTTDSTTQTVIKRARKTDNDSWFPTKVLDSGVNVAPSSVTPYSNGTIYIYNTAFGMNLGTTFNSARSGAPDIGAFQVSLKVCDPAAGLEANCVSYGTTALPYYKPEGLIQKNATAKRFAVTSYTFDNSQQRDGGVLRSNMKYVGPTLPDGSNNTAKEFGTNGILIDNPDGASGGLNSGVINYINKFNTLGYKSYDPAGELFYEGIRYFKHEGPTPEYSAALAPGQDGGFQIVTNWQDPMQYRCQKNFIIGINDANPWLDKKLPGTFFMNPSFTGAYGAVNLIANDYGQPSNPDPDINVRTLTNKVGDLEGLNGTTWSENGTWTSGSISGQNDSVGGGVGTYDASCSDKTVAKLGEVMGTCPYPGKENSYYIAGLAYYANTTDLRPDLASDIDPKTGKPQLHNVQSFFIDTQEFSNNPLDGPKNMLWLAGKYGGFTDANRDGIPQTAEWDANGDGIPDNYVMATKPQALVAGLSQAFNFIDSRTSSSSSAAVPSGSVQSTSAVYQATFNSGNWTGKLSAYHVNSDGTLATTPDWDAAMQLPAAPSRNIFTTNSTGSPAAFTVAGLDAIRLSQLDSNPIVAADKLSYLRGNGSKEGSLPGQFRVRPQKLGDIINSTPIFVGPPPFFYPDSLEAKPYSVFRANHLSRQGVVYAGANDGMLHAFNATTGAEIFGFIPGSIFPKLTGGGDSSKDLTSQSYTHQYFVDGSPNTGDAFFGGAWHTMVVGGLNKGGQSIYALDVTDPSTFTAGNLYKWEFTDPDLGYTFSQPAIVRVKAGNAWVAVFGSGYNNTEADGQASATGHAYLYIVDIATGSLVAKLDTKAGSGAVPNGLATPAVVDVDNDSIADYVYAGDLLGNMWKFDIRDTNPTNWKVAYADGSGNPAPLFTAVDSSSNRQPITERPEVDRGPNGVGMVVLFGTGKYLEPTDKIITPRRDQSFYGIYDKNTGTVSDVVTDRTQLGQQQILTEQVVTAGNGVQARIRTTTANPAGVKGWYMDLLQPPNPPGTYQGERQVSNPLLRDHRVIFTTLIPDPDPCGFGGSSWLMELSSQTGGRLVAPPFDLNRDGKIDDADKVDNGDGTTGSPGGMQWQKNPGDPTPGPEIFSQPGILAGDSKHQGLEYKYVSGTSGNRTTVSENAGKGTFGRQSWRHAR